MRDSVVEHGLLVPDTRSDVSPRLGTPDSTRTRPQQNRHDASQTDSIADIFYPGLHLSFYIVGGGRKEFLQTATVSDNRYLKYPRFGIGVFASSILAGLGDPSERSDDKYTYECGQCLGGGSPVYFYFSDGKVRRIEYSFYLD